MGATPVPCTAVADLARAMEADGWDGLAVGEAPALLPDPYVVLALAAEATTTLRLGTAVAVPLRHPLLAAGAMATLQAIAGGRACFSIGRGDGAMRALRRRPPTVTEFEIYLRSLQGLLRREDVELDGAMATMARIDAIDPGLDQPPPPVDVAASGPRMIALGARWADGVSFSVGADLGRLRGCIDLVRIACEAAGRDPAQLTLGCFVQVAVCDDGDATDRARAREAVRGLVLTHSRLTGYERRPADRTSAVKGRTTRRAGGGPGEVQIYSDEVTDEVIDRFGIVGPPDHCARRLRQIVALGIRRIYLGTRAVGVDLEERNTQRLAREVLPLLRPAPLA